MQKDIDLAQMANVIQNASDKIEAVMNRLRVPRVEEVKEEVEDKLMRMIQKIAELVRDGSVVHQDRQPIG